MLGLRRQFAFGSTYHRRVGVGKLLPLRQHDLFNRRHDLRQETRYCLRSTAEPERWSQFGGPLILVLQHGGYVGTSSRGTMSMKGHLPTSDSPSQAYRSDRSLERVPFTLTRKG